MELIGTVVEIRRDQAIVRFQKACEADCKSCPMGHLFSQKDPDICETEAVNQAGAVVGDRVRLEIRPQTALSAYALAYGVPLAGFLVGAIIGDILAPLFPIGNNKTLSIALFAFVGLIACFAFAVKKGKQFKAHPVIVDVITENKTSDR